MPRKKLLIASSHKEEAITKWIDENSSSRSAVDLIFIEELLTGYEICDELNSEGPIIRWKKDELVNYSNNSHTLLNRVIFINNHLFKSFRVEDREYAQREFEAYLGFSLNAFQSPQYQAINGICERIKSLPQQWQLVNKSLNWPIPEYYWGSNQLKLFADRENFVSSTIYDFLNWSASLKTSTGFGFIKPQGNPMFVLSVGSCSLNTYEGELTKFQEDKINKLVEQLRLLFGYFIFELLIFISEEQMTFGCINIDIIRSPKNPGFNVFLEQNLIKEYYQCLN